MLDTGKSLDFSDSTSPFVAFLGLALIILALISSLFFQKVNAEFFALSGLSLIAAFVVSLWFGRIPARTLQLIPLVMLFAFWCSIGVATAFSPVTFISLGTFWTIAFFPFVALIVLMLSGRKGFEAFAIYGFLAVVTGLAIYACARYFIFHEAPRATFANKNNLAALQMPMAFYAAVCAITFRQVAIKVLFLTLVALFIFTIGIIGSRGVLICLFTGLILIYLVMLKDRWPKKSLAVLLATVLAALIASNLAGSGHLVERAETILAPSKAGSDRFVIWEGSLALAENAPWYGIGPGLFPMVYPQYRLDEDRSAAFFVHNDYLQFLIEAGWPSALLLLTALISLVYVGIRQAFHNRTPREHRLSILVPLIGAGAIAGHSMLSFNLFIPPLLIMMGLLFGVTVVRAQSATEFQFIGANKNRPPRPVAGVFILLATLPALFLLDTGRGVLLHKQATALSEEGNLLEAIEKLETAAQISPNADIYHYLLAWFSFQHITTEGKSPGREFLETAMSRLDRAEQLNPLRPQVHIIRARILESLGDKETNNTWQTSKKLREQIEAEYRKAVAENPFYLEGRFYLARFLLQQNRLEEGLEILENGIDKPYAYNELSVNYYRLTAEMRRILGDQAGYQALIASLTAAIEKERHREQKQPSASEQDI